MTFVVRLAGRALPLLGLALAIGACDRADPTEPSTNTVVAVAPRPASLAVSSASAFRGGIPIGAFHQPTTSFGDHSNGALRNIRPNQLQAELAAIKARGAKVVLMFVGSERHYKDGSGHFDLNKWKARVDEFRGVDFASYVADGTVIGHFLIDEPNDPDNWSGQPVTPAVLEDMARYSKQIWPNLPTIVRAEPKYLAAWSGSYRYLDGAWAQYLHRRGDVGDYISRSVSDAQKKGLALVVGFNILKGGTPTGSKLTASQIESWGSALLSSSYPCAFISWKYESTYMEQSDIQRAMRFLAEKAQNRSSRSCRGMNGQTSGSEPTSSPDPAAPPPPETDQPAPAEPTTIQLKATGPSRDGDRYYMTLTWSGAAGSSVDLYRDGSFRRSTDNDGRTRVIVDPLRRAAYDFQICEAGTSKCSSQITVAF